MSFYVKREEEETPGFLEGLSGRVCLYPLLDVNRFVTSFAENRATLEARTWTVRQGVLNDFISSNSSHDLVLRREEFENCRARGRLLTVYRVLRELRATQALVIVLRVRNVCVFVDRGVEDRNVMNAFNNVTKVVVTATCINISDRSLQFTLSNGIIRLRVLRDFLLGNRTITRLNFPMVAVRGRSPNTVVRLSNTTANYVGLLRRNTVDLNGVLCRLNNVEVRLTNILNVLTAGRLYGRLDQDEGHLLYLGSVFTLNVRLLGLLRGRRVLSGEVVLTNGLTNRLSEALNYLLTVGLVTVFRFSVFRAVGSPRGIRVPVTTTRLTVNSVERTVHLLLLSSLDGRAIFSTTGINNEGLTVDGLNSYFFRLDETRVTTRYLGVCVSCITRCFVSCVFGSR